MTSWRVTETEQGVQFSLKIQPRAAKNEIVGLQGDALKLRLTAPPVEGEANNACVKFIADWLNVPRSMVSIVTGHASRHKIISVSGMDKDRLLQHYHEAIK